MAYDITYNDFNGVETQILIYKGVESGTANDYVTRINADVISTTYPSPQYYMLDIDTITDTGGTFLFEGLGTSSPALLLDWSGYFNWWFIFVIDGVESTPKRWNFGGVTPTPAGTASGYFVVDSYFLGTTTELQLNETDADGGFHILSTIVAGRDSIKAYNYEPTVTITTPTIEGLNCLKSKIGILDGTSHSFCGTESPLTYKWGAEDKYSPFMASEININVIIQDAADNTAMKQIINGGYYVAVYKDSVPFWRGKLTSRFYTEAYAQYPYTIKLNGSDQLGQFDKYQPIMIDFPTPDTNISILLLLEQFLTSDNIYNSEYVGDKITELYWSTRFTTTIYGGVVGGIYLDPLNWMKDDTQYESNKTILSDVLIAMNAKIFQYNHRWYVMDLEAQWDGGDVAWSKYTLNYDGTLTYSGNETDVADFIQPHIASPDDVQVYNNAEMRYEPSWRKLEMNLNYNENNENIDGFANTIGNFYNGQDGVNLEFNDDGDLRYWSGPDAISDYGEDNSGWGKVNRGVSEVIPYINSSIPQYLYDEFNFSVNILGVGGSSSGTTIPNTPTYLYIYVILTIDGGSPKHLDNDEGDSDPFWNDNFRNLVLVGSGEHNINIEFPYTNITGNINLYIGIIAHAKPPRGWLKTVAFKGLKANFKYNEWEAVEYKQTIEKWIQPTDSDVEIIKKDYDWGLYHDTLPNDHIFHRSAMYTSSGEAIPTLGRSGKTGDLSVMDWLGNIMLADNNTYTKTLTASYFSTLTPLSLMVDAEGVIYRFVSGEFNDKLSIWKNIYTEFKAIENAGLPIKGDYSPIEYNDDYYTVE